MDFAKNFLSKYGWKEGQGIGKNLDGIVKPIKANLKFDKDGLGHDKAKDFTNHWWENAYNDAANNIDIEQSSSAGNDAVAISLKNGESIEISTNGISMQKMRKEAGLSGYGTTFQKMRSTLNNQLGDTDDEEQPSGSSNGNRTFALTDEELLRACGGRTAHKGARHGLSLSGKLNRIEEQERQLIEKYSNNFDTNAAQEMFKDWVTVDTHKKKKKPKIKTATTNEITVTSPDSEKLADLLNQSDYVVKYKSKKKKRRHKALDEELATSLSLCLNTTNISDATQTTESDNKLHGILQSSSVIKKKSAKKVEKKIIKKKRKTKIDLGIIPDEDIEIDEVDGIPPEARKYLKRPKPAAATAKDTAVDEIDVVAEIKQTKKCKRKHKEAKAKADNAECAGDDIPKVSKREKSKLVKNNRKIEKIAKKLQSIMSLQDKADLVEKTKKQKKKSKKSI